MRIVFLSNHAWGTPNKAGFYKLAEAFNALGHHVLFITTGLSIFSFLRRDIRLKTGRPLNRLREECPGLYSYLHFTLFHPHTLLIPLLDRMTAGFVRRYDRYSFGEAEPLIRDADVIVYESCSSVCLLKKMKELAPDARHVYRASDIITIMRSLHPEVFQMERENIPLFDMVSVPNETMFRHFQSNKHLFLHPHGVDKDYYDRENRNPYRPGTQNAVFIGNSFFDDKFMEIVCDAFPQVIFHVIGSIPQRVRKKNLLYYQRMGYEDTLKFIKFASVGLYCIHHERSEIMLSWGRSNKIIQYQYCLLPIVIPDTYRKNLGSDEFFFYNTADRESIVDAMQRALNSPHKSCWRDSCISWKQVAGSILSDLHSCGQGEGTK